VDDNVNLGDLLADLLDEAGGVETPASRQYARNGVTFAIRSGEEVIELRLSTDIAEAALRTPDTHASSHGDDWVRFSPPTWDEHARDRLGAWFRVSWRLAEKR
jgi:hypothetical protein